MTDPPSRAPWIPGVVVSFVLLTAVALEILCPAFRSWSVAHPIVVTSGCGALLVVLTALVVERVITRIEGKRWRVPSMLAIDTYLFTADRAVRRIHGRIEEKVNGLPSPPGPTWIFRLNEALELILHQKRIHLLDLSDYLREAADELALVAMQVGGVVSRSDQFTGAVHRIFAQQARLGRLAEICVHLSFLGSGFGGSSDASLRRRAADMLSEAEELMQTFLDELATMRLQVAVEEEIVNG
jgi:hypothetical protein